jgi:hypothetical protein
MRTGLLRIEALPDTWARLLRGMDGRRLRAAPIRPDDPSKGFALWSDRHLREGLLDTPDEEEETPGDEATTDYRDSSATGVKVELIAHFTHVETAARSYQQRPMPRLSG